MKRMILPIGSLMLALLIASGGLVARAREPRGAGADTEAAGKIGSIDMEEVYNNAGLPQELDQAARQHEAEGAQRINKIMAVPYLEVNELEEYGTLIGKLKLTADEDKRVAALKAVNDQRAAELSMLQGQQGAALNAAQQARLTHLLEEKQLVQGQVRQGLMADFRSQHEGYIQDFRHRQLIELRKEVAKLAKEKGIAHVFDAGTLVYSVNDLTHDMLQRLAKRPGKRPGE